MLFMHGMPVGDYYLFAKSIRFSIGKAVLEMTTVLFILALFLGRVIAQYGYSEPSVLLKDDQTERIRGFSNVDGSDFYLAGLTQVHFDINGVKCSEEFSDRGLEETEAMLFAIDSINNDPDLLPNITLGYDIRDYCGVENIAVDDVLQWALKSGLSTSHLELDQCTRNSNGSVLAAVIGAYHSQVSSPVASLLRPFEISQISYLIGQYAKHGTLVLCPRM